MFCELHNFNIERMISLKKFMDKVQTKVAKAKVALENKKAEAYVDTGVKILIAVVIGALLLGALILLFNNVIMPKTSEKVGSMFNMA